MISNSGLEKNIFKAVIFFSLLKESFLWISLARRRALAIGGREGGTKKGGR
jgi:hypothetical protein